MALEAMLRGLAVIAGNSGGVAEAKEGTGFVIPVQPIGRYEPSFDENHMPRPVEAPQDIEPWKQALETLLGNSEIYWREAEKSRQAALPLVTRLRAPPFSEQLRRATGPPLPPPSRRFPPDRALP